MVTPPPMPQRPDEDRRPSLQVKMAASMLRHGRHPHAVARATKVPLVLVEFIDEHLDNHPASKPSPAKLVDLPDKSRHQLNDHDTAGADPHPPVRPAELLSSPLSGAERVRQARRRARIAMAALVGWIANLGLSAAANITHLPALGWVSLILTLVLIVVMVRNVISRSPSGHRPGRDAPPP